MPIIRTRRTAAIILAGAIAVAGLAACDPTDPTGGNPAAGSTSPSAAEEWVDAVAPLLIGRSTTTAHWAARVEEHGYVQTASDLAHSQTGSAYAVDRLDQDLMLILDEADRSEWTTRLRAGESTVDLIVDDLVKARASSEIDWGQVDDEDWLTIAYHLLLGITPGDDATGFTHHLATLEDGSTTRTEVARYIAGTDTARTRTVHRIADELGADLSDTEAQAIGSAHTDDRDIRAALVLREHPAPAC